jgi:predicted HTH transcriptional regulator
MKINLKELAARESERVEWKENGDDIKVAEKIIKTVSAFANDIANTGGGYVVCGAKEGKDEHGFPKLFYTGLTAATLARIQGQVTTGCLERIRPSVSPSITVLDNPEDKATKILVFIVHATGRAHTYRSGGANCHYVRIGDHTKEARNGVLQQLLIKTHQLEYFDKRIHPRASEVDVSVLLFKNYIQEMGLWYPDKPLEAYFSATTKIATFVPPLFGTLKLDQTLRPKNFTLLLFGKEDSITSFYPEAYTVLSIYKGNDRSEATAERHLLVGSLFEQARRAIELLNAQAYLAFDKEHPKPNQVKYPIRALQEAVVNAVVHRDYEMPEPNRITIFADRIEVRSPGALHWGVNKEKFRKGLASPKWRNQSFAYLFNKMQLAQNEGQGIPTIIRTMREEGCPDPRFELEPENVTCILPAHPRHQIIRALQTIQDHVILGNHTLAQEKLTAILEQDLYNFRALELFAETVSLTRNPTALYQLLEEKDIDLMSINSGTLFKIFEALTSTKTTKKVSLFAEKVLRIAMSGMLAENQIVQAVTGLKKLGKTEQVVKFISEAMLNYPRLSKNFSLLEKRATSRIDIAKQCMKTAKQYKNTPSTKNRAWQMCREYLNEAEKDLRTAMEVATNKQEQNLITKHLTFLKNMQSTTQNPKKK